MDSDAPCRTSWLSHTHTHTSCRSPNEITERIYLVGGNHFSLLREICVGVCAKARKKQRLHSMLYSERIILLFPVVIVVLSHALHQHLLMLSLLFQSPSSAFSRLLFPPPFGILFASRFQMENPLMEWHECCWLMIIIAVRIIIFISKYIYI